MAWFSTARGYAGFIWNAGPYNDTAAADALLTLHSNLASRPASVIATDIVTGQTLRPIVRGDGRTLAIKHLALTSRPLSLELLRY